MRKSYDRSQILDFIKHFIDSQGMPPTIGEIQRGLDISSKSVVDRHLSALEDEGHISRNNGVTRGIEVAGMGKRSHSVPLLGIIAAGQPIPVPSEDSWRNAALDTIDVPADFLPPGSQVYALQVKGLSMIDALVDEGDIVILESVKATNNGDMVAAWLRDEESATLKKLYREKDRIRLQPANRTMEPIYVSADNLEIEGRVVAVLRRVR